MSMVQCKKHVSFLALKFQLDNLQQQSEDLFSESFSIQAQWGLKYLGMCRLYMKQNFKVQI